MVCSMRIPVCAYFSMVCAHLRTPAHTCRTLQKTHTKCLEKNQDTIQIFLEKSGQLLKNQDCPPQKQADGHPKHKGHSQEVAFGGFSPQSKNY